MGESSVTYQLPNIAVETKIYLHRLGKGRDALIGESVYKILEKKNCSEPPSK